MDDTAGEINELSDVVGSPQYSLHEMPSERLYQRGMLDHVEDREEYRPGGLHPVIIGDLIGEGDRYRVTHKLRNGGLATVWLCRDTKEEKYVALKILIADSSIEDSPELKLADRHDIDFTKPGGSHVALPLGHFHIQGPNGSHLCIILPVLGPRASEIWETFPNGTDVSRNVALQAAKGLRFLHENGICHGDFRPANILLRLKDFDLLSEKQVIEILGEPRTETLLTVTGSPPGSSGPEYIVQPVDFSVLDPSNLTDQACIIDFGESFDVTNPPESLGIPQAYCSPELIFDSAVGVGCDIWALACTIFEIRSDRKLFEVWDGDDDEVILQTVKLLGKLPDKWWTSWESRNIWYDETGVQAMDEKRGVAHGARCTIKDRLAVGVHFTIVRTGRKVDIVTPPEEGEILTDLLLRMLKYDPEARAPVASVLDHSWFKLRQLDTTSCDARNKRNVDGEADAFEEEKS